MIIYETIKNIPLMFETDNALFSPAAVDKGTLAMLSLVEFRPMDKVLDLGCGYGAVGILAAKLVSPESVVMVDVDGRAAALSRKNAELNNVGNVRIIQSDGFKGVDEKDFTLILSNPPYHTDFSIPKHFIEKGFNRLQIGGKLFMVTKRKEWYKNKLTAIFGGVGIHETDGYFVFTAEKRSMRYSNSK